MANEKLNWEIVNEMVVELIQKTKVVQNENKTGVSYFQGKKRLVKILKSKRNIAIEINVNLPKKYHELAGMQNITPAMAHKKHLGTMKHLYKAPGLNEAHEVIKAAVTQFKKELEQEEKAAQ